MLSAWSYYNVIFGGIGGGISDSSECTSVWMSSSISVVTNEGNTSVQKIIGLDFH